VVEVFNLLTFTHMKPPLHFLQKVILFCIITLISAATAFAQNWSQIIKVTAGNNGGSSARSPEDGYAYSVAISGDYAIVGALFEDSDGNGSSNVLDAGAAYIFFNNAGNWVQVKKITAPVRAIGDVFGISVAIDGDYAVVSAFHEAHDATENNFVQDAGSAYIFKKDQGGTDNWGLVRKITGPVRSAADQFGSSVSISGDYVIVGAFNEDEDADELNTLSDAGSAYIFKKDAGGADNWGQIKKITAGTRGIDDWFGVSVSINGDYAVVGAYREDEDAQEANTLNASGSAYVFKKDEGGSDNWGQVKKITAAIRAATDTFGSSVSINGSYLIVGAPSEKEDALEANSLTSAGAAYIFKKDQGGADNWGQLVKLVPAIRASGDSFGSSVSINGSYAAAGAQGESEDAGETNTLSRAGGAYIFRKDQGGTDNWGQEQKIIATARAISDDFGVSVAISGAFAIVGAWHEDEDALDVNPVLNAGSAYIFKTNDPLPVTLVTFQASKKESEVLLSWSTTMESNSGYFDIQRSNDAHSWKALGRVLAAIESDMLRTYSFIDSDPWDEESSGQNFYRLKMVDRASGTTGPDGLDGSFAYSRIIGLSFGNDRRTILYPNPVSDKLYASQADAAKIASVTITNSAGQIMLRSCRNAKAGISIHDLVPGIYLAQIKKKTGIVQVQKVVVVP
jgi:hypothetical protein